MRVLNFVFNRSKCRGRARFVCCCVILRRCMALLVGCGVALLPARCVALLPARRVALLPARPVDLRAWGEGVVEYPGKVACPSGRRCSTRNAVWLIATAGSNPAATATIVLCEPWSWSDQGSFVVCGGAAGRFLGCFLLVAGDSLPAVSWPLPGCGVWPVRLAGRRAGLRQWRCRRSRWPHWWASSTFWACCQRA